MIETFFLFYFPKTQYIRRCIEAVRKWLFLVRTSWEDVLKYFIFPMFQNLGMVKVEIKAMIRGVQRKIRKCILM